jgi:hypothetical protein
MQRFITGVIAAGALTVALAFPAGAGARTEWVCVVDGEPVVFVSGARFSCDIAYSDSPAASRASR